MKRSEVINLINMTLYDYGLEDEDGRASEAVLSELEKSGILPPPLTSEIKDINDEGVSWIDKYILNMSDNGDCIRWEPEDAE